VAHDFVPVTLGSPRFDTRDLGALRVTDARFPPRAYLPPHEHERPIVAVILEGSWDERFSTRAHECLPATVLVEPAEERHDNRFHDAGARVLVIEPDPREEALWRPCARLLGAATCFRDLTVAGLARRLAAEIERPDALTPLAMEGAALELLAVAARRPPLDGPGRRAPAWLRTVMAQLHDDVRRPPTLAELARTAGVHPAHLARVFRTQMGASLGAYARRLRLEWCAQQLAHGDQPLGTIAQRAGFADQSHFTRAFRQRFGVTPGAYREARRSPLVSF
jgi:AraC family transcriptional regulator